MQAVYETIRKTESLMETIADSSEKDFKVLLWMSGRPLTERPVEEQIETLEGHLRGKYLTAENVIEDNHERTVDAIKTEFKRKMKESIELIKDQDILADKLSDLKEEMDALLEEEKCKFAYLKSIIKRTTVTEVVDMKKGFRHEMLINKK